MNLPRNGQPENIRIDGKIPHPNSKDRIELITESELRVDIMPFKNASSKPRLMAGPILEITLNQRNTREQLQISFQLK